MFKKITEEQIKMIEDTIFQLNVPVQVYASLQKLFKELPEIKTEQKK